MVIVVGMIAAVPASTKVLPGPRSEISDDGNLPILILINRLELSEEQMNSLLDILSNLLEVKAQPEALLYPIAPTASHRMMLKLSCFEPNQH